MAILFSLRKPTVVSKIVWLEFKGNLTIVAIYFYLRNLTVVSLISWLEFEGN